MKEHKQYYPVIDVLRVLAILAVVFIHTTTRTIETSANDLNHFQWTLFLNQSLRFAVPLFFLISGFVLELTYPFHANYITYLKKRFSRIIIPYIFWSGMYYFIIHPEHSTTFFETLLYGDAYYHLYFIPTLLIFYVLFPLLHRYIKVFSSKWTLVSLGVIQILVLWYDYYVQPLQHSLPIRIAMLNFAVFIFGAVGAKYTDVLISIGKKWGLVLVSVTILLSSVVFFEGKYFYEQTHNYLMFYSQWRPSVFVYTIVFALSAYYFLRNIRIVGMIKTLSKLSFFVFFVHVVLLEKLWDVMFLALFKATNQSGGQLWFDPLYFASVASASFFLGFLVHKIPFVAKVTG